MSAECQKCGKVPRPGELYVEVHRAEDRDGTTLITRGHTTLLAHLNCPSALEDRIKALEKYVEHLKMWLPDDIPTPKQVASWQQ